MLTFHLLVVSETYTCLSWFQGHVVSDAFLKNTFAERGTSAFEREVLDVMDNIDYRRIKTRSDMEEIGHLRQRAFDAFDIYDQKFGSCVIEDMDFDPLAHVFGVYYRGELASTVRIKKVTADNRVSSAITIFGDVMNPLLDQGMVFVDPCRLAIDREISRHVPGLPIITSRLAIIATLFHEADYCLFACKQLHSGFYRRIFNATMLAGPYQPEGFNVQAVLLGNGVAGRQDLFDRYPMFQFQDTEARLLFGNVESASNDLCVLPTARIALKAA